MEYTLKNKLSITKEFLTELESKSWQEIEYLQSQIANIEVTAENAKLIQLFKNLLTSYYVFVGGLENLDSEDLTVATPIDNICINKEQISTDVEKAVGNDDYHDEPYEDDIFEPVSVEKPDGQIEADIEPFEYFVDFDEPTGEPLSDEDLYGK